MADFYDDYDKNLYSKNYSDAITIEVDPINIASGSLVSEVAQNVGNLQNAKTTFDNTKAGYILGTDKGIAKFYLGDSSKYLTWDGTTLTISGGIDTIDQGINWYDGAYKRLSIFIGADTAYMQLFNNAGAAVQTLYLSSIGPSTYSTMASNLGTSGSPWIDGYVNSLKLAAASSTRVPLNLPAGVPPDTPVEGDLWYEDVAHDGLKLYDANKIVYLSRDPQLFGSGEDGDLAATGATNTNPISTYIDEDSAAAQKTLNVNSSASFAANDVIFVHQVMGTNAGAWEIQKIKSVATGTITCYDNLENAYTYSISPTYKAAQVFKIPQYGQAVFKSGATLSNSTWPSPAWDGYGAGGVSVIYASKGIIVESGVTLSMNTKGYQGGHGATVTGAGYQGEGTASSSDTQSTARNGTGGSGGATSGTNVGADGGFIVDGGNASGQGGYGFIYALTNKYSSDGRKPVLIFGGAGGGGGNNGGPVSGAGGNSGGIILWIAPFIVNLGTVSANGASGTTSGSIFGGAGSGGMIAFASPAVYNATTPTVTNGGGTAASDGLYLEGMIPGLPNLLT